MSENIVMRTRKDFLASEPVEFRVGNFLNPSFTVNSSNIAFPFLPRHAFTYKENNSRVMELNVNFKGWPKYNGRWNDWVQRLEPVYGTMWRMLGINDAIKSTTLVIKPHKDVVLGVARKWFPLTNSFVFKWGEATITLEDVFVLGFYPISGTSIMSSSTQEIEEMDNRLWEARRHLNQGTAKKVSLSQWMNVFQEDERFTNIEHVGFLVFWLSTYVFPKAPVGVVGPHVHNIAIRLAMGVQISLAPAVLASLYRDLRNLKEVISTTRASERDILDQREEVEVWGPMHLVQIWARERIHNLRPQDNHTERGQSGLNVDQIIENDDPLGFIFRPYSSLYGQVIMLRHPVYEEVARMVRPSELVGLESIEQYLPHRVARQLGFDQDLPGVVKRYNQSQAEAWQNFTRPVEDNQLFIPRETTAVTMRYKEWWNNSKSFY